MAIKGEVPSDPLEVLFGPSLVDNFRRTFCMGQELVFNRAWVGVMGFVMHAIWSLNSLTMLFH